MKKGIILATAATLFLSGHAFSQAADRSGFEPDMDSQKVHIHVRDYVSLLAKDFATEITAPAHISQTGWLHFGIFAAIEGGMFTLDRPVQKEAVGMMQRNAVYKTVSNAVTGFGSLYEGYTLAALGAYSWALKNEQLKNTTLLATQACIVGGVMETAIKLITGRQGPYYTDAVHLSPAPTFHGPSFALHHDVSFPSGHTTEAFAAATVFASEYRDHPMVVVLCYGAATAVGLSRITENAHWISDVFAGAGLGYLTGRTVVNNFRRFVRDQDHKTSKLSYSFDVRFNYNHLEPALVLRLK